MTNVIDMAPAVEEEALRAIRGLRVDHLRAMIALVAIEIQMGEEGGVDTPELLAELTQLESALQQAERA
jgi:hypothetical protein